jgi:hypothetical protein
MYHAKWITAASTDVSRKTRSARKRAGALSTLPGTTSFSTACAQTDRQDDEQRQPPDDEVDREDGKDRHRGLSGEEEP